MAVGEARSLASRYRGSSRVMPFSIKLERLSNIALGGRACDAGLWRKAMRYYEKELRRHPDNSPILVQYGHLLKEVGQLAPAERAYRKAIASATGTADTYLQLGHVLKLEGKPDEARTAYLVAFVLEPEASDAARELSALGWPKDHLSRLLNAVAAKSDAAPVLQPNEAGPAATPAAMPAPAQQAAADPQTAAGRARFAARTRTDDALTALVDRLCVREEVHGSPIDPQDNMCSPGREQPASRLAVRAGIGV